MFIIDDNVLRQRNTNLIIQICVATFSLFYDVNIRESQKYK